MVADGIRLGRRTFANTLKYIRVTVSANFGNVVSMVVAAVLLPFLPMLPVQILLLNLMSDVPAMTIAADRVGDDALRSPRQSSVSSIRTFMIVFGLVSSAFDIAVFAILRWGLHADATLFHSSWFVLSLMTELLALLVLRTGAPFWRSRPSAILLAACVVVAILGFALPFLPVAEVLGLTSLAGPVLITIGTLCLAYALANELTKWAWCKRWEWD